jgi:hypothetical protein
MAGELAFGQRIREMVAAVERGDGAAVAACFTPDGVYHDVFYGAFQGGDIARMIDDYFWRDARDFRWDIHDPVEAGGIGYGRYVFSYVPVGEVCGGRRVMFEGVAICRMRDGLIAEYREIARETFALVEMEFAAGRVVKYITRQGAALKARAEAERHR